jgi:UDP:flavonoid glycosyltransferase YjiC (YdhE family)
MGLRIVFPTHPALGHLLPMLPLAIAARDAGHDVVVLSGSSVASSLERVGLRHVVAGPPDLPTAWADVPERAGLTGRRLAAVTWSRVFGGVIAPQMAAGLLALAATWRPDLVIHDDSEQGTWIAAERLGIPHVALQATAWRSTGIRLSAEPLGRLRDSLGLPADAGLTRWHRNGFLATRPARLLNPDDPPPVTSIAMRPVALDEGPDAAPPWLAEPRSRRRVAVTLGTMLPGRLESMESILEGIADLDVEVAAAVGPGVDPGALGDRGPFVHVERYIPMARLLPESEALVFHGGSGTMLAALAVGVPLVVLPVAADQPENADRCVAAGVGIALEPSERTPAAIGAAVGAVLADPRYRDAAALVRDEIAAMPAPSHVLPALERLAAEGPEARLTAD